MNRLQSVTSGQDPEQRPLVSYGTAAAESPLSVHHHDRVSRLLSALSAALILAGGYIHFCLYRNGYRFIPKIGIAFFLQFSSSAIIAAALVVVRGRLRIARHTLAVAQLVRLSGVGLTAGTLAALGIAHTPMGLFAFREFGLRPAPQTLVTILVESIATVLLVAAMLYAHAPVHAQNVEPCSTSPHRSRRSRAA
jgi:hypothetical protein